jgi:hypothetical protein
MANTLFLHACRYRGRAGRSNLDRSGNLDRAVCHECRRPRLRFPTDGICLLTPLARSHELFGHPCVYNIERFLRSRIHRMQDELWASVTFKLDEARFFFSQMGKVLVPARLDTRTHHPAHGCPTTKWQPDFYYYFDAFVGAARSVPDVVQKCFGLDPHSSKGKWACSLDANERDRRTKFQGEFTTLYSAFHKQILSGVRTGIFHWLGVAPVQTKAKVEFAQEYTGRPLDPVPSAACKEFPLGTDPDKLPPSAFQSLPAEPSWQDFTLQIPQDDGTIKPIPLFEECESYLKAAEDLVTLATTLCERVHGKRSLTQPPAIDS